MHFTVHHTAISAVEMKESITFYSLFGFELALHYKDPSGNFEIAHLKLGNEFLEIFWYRDQESLPESASSLSTDLPRIGVKHLGLRVSSVREAKEFVERHGLASDVEIREGKTGVVYFFIKDPSGILLEILEDNRGL